MAVADDLMLGGPHSRLPSLLLDDLMFSGPLLVVLPWAFLTLPHYFPFLLDPWQMVSGLSICHDLLKIGYLHHDRDISAEIGNGMWSQGNATSKLLRWSS